eukprot:Rhum_TRINITY_DN9815_c0_g1::Rhum_TRINITY_DN9815_c0_g1_i2::g.35409::m.35409
MGEYAALAAAAEEDIIDGLSATRRSSAPALASGGVGGRADTPSLSSSLSGTPSHLGQTVRRPSDGARPRALEKRKSLQTTASDSLSDSVSMLLGGRELGSENTVRGGSGSGDGRPTSLRLSKTSLAAIGSSTSQQPRMAKRKSITFAFDFPAVPDEPVSAGSALGSPASPASPAATEAAAPSAAFPAVAFDAGAPRPASRTASDVSSAGTAAAGPHATETLDMYPKPFSRASPARRMRFEGAGDLETSPRRRRGGPDAGGAGTEAEKPRGDEAKESSEGDAGVASAAQATPAPAPAAAVRTTGRLTHYDAAAYAQFASGEHGTTVGPAGLPTNNPAGASVSAPSPAVAAAAAAARHRLGRSPVALPLPHEVTAPLTGVDRDLHALSMVRGQRAAFALETDELHNQYYSTGSRAYYDDGHGEEVEAAGQPMSVALDDKADALGRAVFLLEKELHGLQARHAGALRVQQETEAAQRRLQASRDGVEIDFDGDGSRGAALAASEADAALDMGSVRAAHAEWRACVQRAGVVLESVFEELQRQRKASMLALDGDEPRWDLARLESRLIAAQAKLDDMALVGRGDAPYAAAAPAAPAPETLQHSTQTAAPPPPTPPQPAPLPSWRAAPADAASSAPRAPETASHQGTLRSDAMSLSATAPAPFPTPLTSAEVTATAPAPAPSTATAGEPAPGAVYPIGGRPLRAATSFVEGFSYSTPSRRLRHTPAAARVTGGGSAAAGGVPAVPQSALRQQSATTTCSTEGGHTSTATPLQASCSGPTSRHPAKAKTKTKTTTTATTSAKISRPHSSARFRTSTTSRGRTRPSAWHAASLPAAPCTPRVDSPSGRTSATSHAAPTASAARASRRLPIRRASSCGGEGPPKMRRTPGATTDASCSSCWRRWQAGAATRCGCRICRACGRCIRRCLTPLPSRQSRPATTCPTPAAEGRRRRSGRRGCQALGRRTCTSPPAPTEDSWVRRTRASRRR